MKKLVIAVALAVSALGMAGVIDAATGIVNVDAVLKDNVSFQRAGRTVASEQKKLQKQFDEESKNMSQNEKEKLAKTLNAQLAEKEQSIMKPIQDKFKSAVEKAAKEKNVDTVVVPGGILYGTIETDLTEDVKTNMK